ncbi:MAG: hypothetical protein EKK37_04230 [Sphingobacteriales bacterium]|nr:MAG: hypothetical protein EKK37_04230 [Sphingobacteriales bacterium]
MKKINVLSVLLVILLIMPVSSYSQEKKVPDSSSALAKESSYILAGAAFNSDIVFLGRKSAIKSPYISASAGYYHKSGFFITGIVSYLASSQQNRIDLFTTTGGYDYYKKDFTAGISATGYIFNNKSYTAKSALTANLNAYADYDFDILEVYVDGTVYFSNQSDFIFSVAISHNFYTANDNLKISPTFSLYSGTQNYYSNYNNNKRFGQHMINAGGINTMGTGMMSGSIFNIQNYEFSIPVRYDLKHFRFQFLPIYAIPVNPATITDNLNTYKEDLSNTFFWSMGVFYKFSKQKK